MRASCFALSTVTVLVGVACTSVQSADIKTAGMPAYLRVTGNGNGQTTASAQFNVDNNPTDFVDLSSGDTAVATAGSVSQTMSRATCSGPSPRRPCEP